MGEGETHRYIVHLKTGLCARHALSVTFDVSWTGCALRKCCKSEGEEREKERERDHMKIGPCALCVLGVTFDVSLAVLSGSVASVRRRERERLFT